MLPTSKNRNVRPDPRRNATPASPWAIGNDGRTNTVVGGAKVRQFLETYLFTAPGERLNRPTYGAGVMSLIFGGATQVEQTLRQGIEGGLTQELLDLIEILAVESDVVDSTVRVTIRYRLLQPGTAGSQPLHETFERPL